MVTWLSALSLATACGFASRVFVLPVSNGARSRLFWILLTVVLGFLALDEFFRGHEQLGKFIAKTSVGDPVHFRNWNDLIVILYGVVAVVAGVFFLPEVLRHPRFAEFVAVAFIFYCIPTCVDSTSPVKTKRSVITEESAKLLCSVTLALTMLVTWLHLRAKQPREDSAT